MLYIFAVIKRNYFEIIMCVCFSLDTKHVHFEVISFFSLKRGISTYLKLTMVMFETKGRVTQGNFSCNSHPFKPLFTQQVLMQTECSHSQNNFRCLLKPREDLWKFSNFHKRSLDFQRHLITNFPHVMHGITYNQ